MLWIFLTSLNERHKNTVLVFQFVLLCLQPATRLNRITVDREVRDGLWPIFQRKKRMSSNNMYRSSELPNVNLTRKYVNGMTVAMTLLYWPNKCVWSWWKWQILLGLFNYGKIHVPGCNSIALSLFCCFATGI